MKNKVFDLDLYKFQNLSRALDKWGFPTIDFESGFKVIKGVDFEKAYKAGNIRFEDDGIYLDFEDLSLKGYMFIREPYIEKYGSYPRFHIVKCKTIEDFLHKGLFDKRYDFSNSEINDLIDKTSGNLYKDEELNLCSNCRTLLNSEIDTTRDFYELLGDFEKVDDIEVDIFGYQKGWDQLSRAFREMHDYTCEECGIQVKKALDKRFIQVHHVDGDKTNNSENNLRCLCILCHANQDERHKENFSKGSRNIDLNSFVEKYKDELMGISNPFFKIKR
ncbi:HNH endonuclease signature motif containing protein [Mongoliitalea daihaiensis]|uniref:HNH endonuclease signature motif containing protein n=1 Tax=Mongoliitalea daihaiensis TaxID=2782006 RepID=UPI001F2F3E3A|nr:HNH endonuclease signature motif containing protein [Mongoliitalea daihaiensis]UJP65134.1 HNH endonuclease [Mongoliitalea daihaiensis]